jgi:anti-sigma regulatory factor (Ser/Thr protein kinase)/putative methionine-R-sulfoxide reductase with GAF domain
VSGLDQPDLVAAERLRRIQALTDGELARLSVEDLLAAVVGRVRELLDVDTVAVLLVDPSATWLVATVTSGLEEETRQGVRIPLGKGFAGRIAAERKAVTIAEVDHSNVLNPILREKGVRSLLGVPLLAGDEVIGVLHVGTLRPRLFTDEDTELLQLAADRIAPATQARLSRAERNAATALQRSLLPAGLPTVPDIELAARYVPGGGGEVGGDWYDVFDLPSGRFCVVVGDVVGRGLAASIAMGRLRSAVRAYALLTERPDEVLALVSRQVQHFEQDVMATVLCAVVDIVEDTVTLSSAGHPPPVLTAPGEPSALVDLRPDPPIGLAGAPRRSAVTRALPAGSGLVLYTDGLVERRHESLDTGLERLLACAHYGPAEQVCATVMGRMIGNETSADDVALLALTRLEPHDAQSVRALEPATPRALRTLRQTVRGFLERAGASPDDTADVVLAVGEAAANVVEHAYGPGGGMIDLHLGLDGTRLRAVVRDTGAWRASRGAGRGRGVTLIEGVMDRVEVSRTAAGTHVLMEKDIR